MPELIEQMYCSQQIVIPPKFPYLLKRYCKAAIKTQPYDLLRWSYEYFTALAQHRPPPVKLRLEYPVYSTEGGLTRGCLKVLANQKEMKSRVCHSAVKLFFARAMYFESLASSGFYFRIPRCARDSILESFASLWIQNCALALKILLYALVTQSTIAYLMKKLLGMPSVPLVAVRQAWQGFCLDSHELNKILCLCEVFLREDTVPFLHFIAVAGGLLTKTLTHTMILLCETLTHEPDGGSAAIPVQDFLVMYRFLARMNASKDVKYLNGYREGVIPKVDSTIEEEEHQISEAQTDEETLSDEYWVDSKNLTKLTLINDHVPKAPRLSAKLNMPILGKIERSPSIERAGQMERENYMRERRGRASASDDVEEKLREMSGSKDAQETESETVSKQKEEKFEKKKEGIEIIVVDEDGKEIPYELYGEPMELTDVDETGLESNVFSAKATESKFQEIEEPDSITQIVNEWYENRLKRVEDLAQTFGDIAAIVDRFKSASYDLGMVAGRQMSTTSGEFVVAQVERDIMDYINEQIDILPDPDLKKKKAKPEEVVMIRELLDQFLDENMDIIVPDIEDLEEEEQPIPDVILVHAVPGIGPIVDDDIIFELEQFLLEASRVQADVIMPRNLRHFMCPPIEKYEEHNYDNLPTKEEVARAGVITD